MKKKRKNIKPWVKNILVGILIALVAFSAVGALLFFNVGADDITPLSSCSHSEIDFEHIPDTNYHTPYCVVCGLPVGANAVCDFDSVGSCKYCSNSLTSSSLSYFLSPFSTRVWSNDRGGYFAPELLLEDDFYFARSPDEGARVALSSYSERCTVAPYLFIKYRMLSDEPSYIKLNVTFSGVFTYTLSALSYGSTSNDWKILYFDLTDVLQNPFGTSTTILFEIQHDFALDLAYIAMSDDLSVLRELVSDDESYYYSNNDLLSSVLPYVAYDNQGVIVNCLHDFKNSTCTLCGTRCEHNFVAGTNACTICGSSCPHSDEYILYEIYPEYHIKFCSACGETWSPVTHNFWYYGSHIEGCVCGSGCTHYRGFPGGECPLCGQACFHSENDRVYTYDPKLGGHKVSCGNCNEPLPDENCKMNLDGFCTLCGYRCPAHKLNSSGYCYDCYYQCPHAERSAVPSTGSHLVLCLDCEAILEDNTAHVWENGICSVCGYECVHILVEGSCGICGFACSHSNGSIVSIDPNGHVFRCSDCQSLDTRYPHDLCPSISLMTSHFCTVCGYESAHTWVLDGEVYLCSGCRLPCVHTDFTIVGTSSDSHTILCSLCGGTADITHIFNGLTTPCDICGYRCNHEWREGDCVLCNYPCPHVYVGGTCSICKYRCINHEYNERGICANCGGMKQTVTEGFEVGFINLFSAIYDAQANTFFSLLGYNIMGINIANLIIAVVGLGIIAFVLKKVI